jgi:hypothetical protein
MLQRGSRINLYTVQRQWLEPKSCVYLLCKDTLVASTKKCLIVQRDKITMMFA